MRDERVKGEGIKGERVRSVGMRGEGRVVRYCPEVESLEIEEGRRWSSVEGWRWECAPVLRTASSEVLHTLVPREEGRGCEMEEEERGIVEGMAREEEGWLCHSQSSVVIQERQQLQ